MMQILFLSRWFPYPPNNGSKLRIYNLLKGLNEYHNITLISFSEQNDVPVVDSNLMSSFQGVNTIPWKQYNPSNMSARLGYFNTQPRSIVDTFSSQMKYQIEQTIMAQNIDVVVASEIDMGIYGKYFHGLPAILEDVEIGVLHEQYSLAKSPVRRLRYGLTWVKYRRYLNSVLKNFQLCTVVSKREHQLVSQVIPMDTSIEIIPNGVDLDNYCDVQSKPKPNTIIFTGSFSYSPNYEAMIWFLKEVYPIILLQVPDAHLYITGDHGGLSLPTHENLTLTGYVDDIRNLIASSWCSIVPIHTGGGTRIKILEAMALKTPVVCTTKGVEGIDVTQGEHLLIADSPEKFAEAIIKLFSDDEYRQELVANGYKLIREKYDWKVIMPDMLNLVEQAVNV